MLALFALATPRQAVLAALDDMEHELAFIGYERMMKAAKAALDQKAQDAYNGRPCESWMSALPTSKPFGQGAEKGLDKVSRTGELKRLFDQLDGQVVPLRAIASHTRGAKLSGTELADIVKGHLPKL